jgi:hypothetical protein
MLLVDQASGTGGDDRSQHEPGHARQEMNDRIELNMEEYMKAQIGASIEPSYSQQRPANSQVTKGIAGLSPVMATWDIRSKKDGFGLPDRSFL